MLVCISDVVTQYNVARIIRDSLSGCTGSFYSSETDTSGDTGDTSFSDVNSISLTLRTVIAKQSGLFVIRKFHIFYWT